MFDKLKLKSLGSNIPLAEPAATANKPPSRKQIYQNRKNFGVNIGSCFVLEKWIFHQLFEDQAGCELEAVAKMVEKKGKDETKKCFEDFWKGFLDDNDWKWLHEHNVTSIRVPLGYWDVDGGKFTKGTKFEKYNSIYANAWNIFKKDFVEKANEFEISVLVDIHGLPHGANGSDHSGESSGGKAGFWDNLDAQLLICDLVQFVADDLKQYENIAGIQIVNEAEFANDPKKQVRYYAAAILQIRSKDKSIPIIISDGWWPDQWAKWVQEKNGDGSIGVVIDHHCYRCFSDQDKSKSPRKIIDDLNDDLLTNISKNGEGVDFMVGEYSCVLDGASWDKDNANSNRDQLVIEYGKRQCELLSQRANFGTFFWTYKFQSGNGGEWDFKTMTDKGAIAPVFSLKGKDIPGESTMNEKLDANYNDHVNYWNGQNHKEKYEHERYKEGFATAWRDSEEFAKFNGSVLGRVYAWKTARLQEHKNAKGSLNFIWEWEQGFDKGLQEFLNSV